MIDYSLEITPLAEREIADGFAWYFSRNPVAADTFRTLVFDAFAMIAHSPLSWAKVSERGVRKFVLSRYPYTVFFSVSGNTVLIVSVSHNRRARRDWDAALN